MAGARKGRVSIGKFEILAGYTCAKARLGGRPEDEVKERGMVAAIMGAKAKLGWRSEAADEFRPLKDAAERE
jgi:hypothetical protein